MRIVPEQQEKQKRTLDISKNTVKWKTMCELLSPDAEMYDCKAHAFSSINSKYH